MDGDAMQRMVCVMDASVALAWLTKPCAKYESTRVMVTPEIAAAWLTKNTRNRKPITSRVEEWSRLMGEGRWITEADTVDFGADGTLFNGQHRLMAVVKGKHSIEMMVRRNCPNELLGAVDNNEARSAAQILKIEKGMDTSTNMRASVTCARSLVKAGQAHSGPRQTKDDLQEALDEFLGDYRAIRAAMHHENSRLSTSGIIGSLAVIHRAYPELSERFAAELRDGSELKKGSPVLVLRDYALGARSVQGGMSRDEISRVTFAAFDAYLKGESRVFVRTTNELARQRHIEAWKKASGK
jgi:hypothetical protein